MRLSSFHALAFDFPWEAPTPEKPLGANETPFFDWFGNNAGVMLPALALTVVVLIAIGIIAAWRNEDLDGLLKAELKREIIRLLRREVYGLPAMRLAELLDVPGGKLLNLLEEMAADHILESTTNTARVTTWRIKGLTQER